MRHWPKALALLLLLVFAAPATAEPTTGTVVRQAATSPDVTRFRITRNPFRVGGLGTVIRWSQSEPGEDTIGFERRVGGQWRKLRRKMRFQATAGDHNLRFRGRFDLKHPLRPGRWRMTLTARDTAGNESSPDRLRFRLLPEKRG